MLHKNSFTNNHHTTANMNYTQQRLEQHFKKHLILEMLDITLHHQHLKIQYKQPKHHTMVHNKQLLNNVIDERKNIIKPNAPAGTRVDLEVGDMLVYSGCELEHWRESFEGDSCGQVFLHYNDMSRSQINNTPSTLREDDNIFWRFEDAYREPLAGKDSYS